MRNLLLVLVLICSVRCFSAEKIQTIQIVQIQSSYSALCIVRGELFLVKGNISFSNCADGMLIRVNKPFEIDGNYSYINGFGLQRTVRKMYILEEDNFRDFRLRKR